MARISSNILTAGFVPSLTLDRYQEIMRLPIAAFNGLNKPDEEPQYQCSAIWKQSDRDYIAQYLAASEEKREQFLGFPLSPKYYSEVYEYMNPLVLDRKHLVAIGTRKYSDISIGEAVPLGTTDDPVVITVATTVTTSSEIKVYYPGEDVEIHPSNISISGGNATIRIPRSRLVDPDYNDDREDPLDYHDDSYFLTTVDIKREYYDISDAVYFVWSGLENCCWPPSTDLTDKTQLAYPRIDNSRLSIVEIVPATYASGTFSRTTFTYRTYPSRVSINYRAGDAVSVVKEMTTARLAHTMMPYKPVSCPTVHMYWEEDRIVDDGAGWTPYGNSRGAIEAWMSDNTQKIGQGGMFPAPRR